MAQIIKSYTTLEKYQETVKHNPEELKPNNCDRCGCGHVWQNGLYERAISGRDRNKQKAEPVEILRFKCSRCKNHYSVLPSIIPLLRWYLWCMQEWVLSMVVNGYSIQRVAKVAKIARRTVSRWYCWLNDKFKIICNTLCQSKINQYQGDFSSLLSCHDLSNIAEILHQEKILIPYSLTVNE
jgi:transposase-like protein